MNLDDNSGVNEEAAAPIAEDMGNAYADPQTQETEKQGTSDAEINFARLRESNERLQREREQDRQMMMALQQKLLEQEQVTQRQPEPEDPFSGLDPDDWMTADKTRQAAQTIAEKIAEEKARKIIEEYENKRRKEELPQRIKTRFQDFDSVVTEENVKQLQALEPDVAQALGMIGDEEAKAVAAYKYIKAFVPNAANITEEKQRIEQNSNQPKTLGAVAGRSPLAQAANFERGLTPEVKQQLYAEMVACARQS